MTGIFPDPVIKDPKVEALTILMEEAAEIIQEVTKALRFGIEHRHPAKDYDAMDGLSREIGQLVAMIRILRRAGLLRDPAMEAGTDEKFEKLRIYSNLPEAWLG